jgi:hypothetical protein
MGDRIGQIRLGGFRCEHDSRHSLTLHKYSLLPALGGTSGIPKASSEFRDTLHYHSRYCLEPVRRTGSSTDTLHSSMASNAG